MANGIWQAQEVLLEPNRVQSRGACLQYRLSLDLPLFFGMNVTVTHVLYEVRLLALLHDTLSRPDLHSRADGDRLPYRSSHYS